MTILLQIQILSKIDCIGQIITGAAVPIPHRSFPTHDRDHHSFCGQCFILIGAGYTNESAAAAQTVLLCLFALYIDILHDCVFVESAQTL